MHDSHFIEEVEGLMLLDLMPLEDLQHLQNILADLHSVASVVTDPQGNILTLPSKEIAVCRLVQRTAKGFRHCVEKARDPNGKTDSQVGLACHQCKRIGILKAVVPIKVNGIHLADWWVGQYCAEITTDEEVRRYAEQIGISVEGLTEALQSLPKGEEEQFYKIIEGTKALLHQLITLAYEKYLLNNNITPNKISGESQLEDQVSRVERQVEARTADLIKANNRLQLEALERDLAEEQKERKTRLLDAINLIFQHTLRDQSDETLAQTLLTSARRLTGSPYGFVAEKKGDAWQVVAIDHDRESPGGDDSAMEPDAVEISHLWRQLMTREESISIPAIDGDGLADTFPTCHPPQTSFLVTALCQKQRIKGLVAVGGKKDVYAPVDQQDVEALAQAHVETLLRKRFEAQKAASEKRLNLALDSANEGMWDYAPVTGMMYYSPRWFSMLGYMPGEFPETMETWNTLTHPDDVTQFEETLNALAKGVQVEFNIEIRMLAKSGRWCWLQVRGRTVEAEEKGLAIRIVGTLIDISKYKQVEVALQKANNELQRLAALDDLTQIANRRRFEDRLAQEWRRGQRDNQKLAVILCDIDYFKDYNDTYGHLKGDETLYAVAQAISAALKRPMDLVARFGGEEFAMILPNTDIAGGKRVAMEVKSAVASLGINHQTSKVNAHITLSFGVSALLPEYELSPKILIEATDRALYRAKSKGRNQIVCIAAEENGNGDDRTE